MIHSSWSNEEVEEIKRTEQNMEEVLDNPSSSYTDMANAIDEFFASW